MTRIALISGCDANYYPLLREWIHSVRRFSQSGGMDIMILDAGLTGEQRDELTPLVKKIERPDWPWPLPQSKIKGREFLKACVCRPFLPRIFPGYDVYFWMDADTWVQDWTGPELFLKGAEKKKISLTCGADRAYPRAARIKWLWRWPWKVRNFYFSNAREAFGFNAAKELLSRHVLLSGAFALRADAPHWKRWQELAAQAAGKGNVFTAEQVSLGVMCHLENFECEILPAWAHWLCEFKPLWDEEKNSFVEPYSPHMNLGILHISGWDAMRLDRAVATGFKTTRDNEVQKSYRYPFFDGSRGN